MNIKKSDKLLILTSAILCIVLALAGCGGGKSSTNKATASKKKTIQTEKKSTLNSSADNFTDTENIYIGFLKQEMKKYADEPEYGTSKKDWTILNCNNLKDTSVHGMWMVSTYINPSASYAKHVTMYFTPSSDNKTYTVHYLSIGDKAEVDDGTVKDK
jgi:hypothetical protein